jgi:ABC-type multidrug transport system ATPase subunit
MYTEQFYNGSRWITIRRLRPTGFPLNSTNWMLDYSQGWSQSVVAYFFDEIDFNKTLKFKVQAYPSYTWNSFSRVQRSLFMNMISTDYLNKLSGSLIRLVPMETIEIKAWSSHSSPIQILDIFTNGVLYFVFILISPLPLLFYHLLNEKAKGTQDMMRMMGMKMLVYWPQFYLWNLLNYLVVIFAGIIIGLVYRWEFMLKSNAIAWILPTIIWFFNLNAFIYLASTIVTNIKFGLVLSYLVVLLDPFAGMAVAVSLNMFSFPYSYLLSVRYIFPTQGLHEAVSAGILLQCVRNKCPSFDDIFAGGPLAIGLIVMISQTLLWILIAILIDNRGSTFILFRPFWALKSRILYLFFKPSPVDPLEEEDVKEERDRVMNSPDCDSLLIKNVSKSYGSFFALSNLCLEIKRNEFFGLLGPNGSGKSTLMKMICGMASPTYGDVFINGMNLDVNMEKLQLLIGYCPQHPLLFDDLSVESNLLFYSRLKGIPRSIEYANMKHILKRVKLLSLGSNSTVASLSGGMKQRLSLAIALVGNPAVLLLDEPTSDLDPMSKRAMWDILMEIKENKSIILTTHSLEEAEVLCDRIGIISHGELQCIGTTTRLKSKYGMGYLLSVYFDRANSQDVQNFVEKTISDVKLVSEEPEMMKFSFSKNIIKLSSLFDVMKDQILIRDFSVSNSTLEGVYVNIVNEGTMN